MSVTKAWKVYGREGHRIKESFGKSTVYDFSDKYDGTRFIHILREDVTGTNEYVIVFITRNTAQECYDEMTGQITDGIFENQYTGIIDELELSKV